MSLDPKQFTEKTGQVLVAAQDLARESSHVELTPLHLMKALLDDADVSIIDNIVFCFLATNPVPYMNGNLLTAGSDKANF
jgi:hypothetical protein